MDISYQLQQQVLDVARRRFADGDALPDRLLPPSVQRSWERSRHAGMLPWQSPNYQALQPRPNPNDDPADRLLVQCVRDEIEQLWGSFGGPDWTIFCINPQGTIVHARQSGLGRPAELKPIEAGRRIQEIDIGTTAPACALAEGDTVAVRGNQHYLTGFEHFFCLSTPLRGLDGEIIGALDITGLGERDTDILRGYFRQAAFAIENRLYAQQHVCHLISLQHDARWLDTPLQGLLAIREDGTVRAANRLARRLLGLPMEHTIDGLPLSTLFADATPAQLRRLLQPGHEPRRMPLHAGMHVYTRLLRGPKTGGMKTSTEASHITTDDTFRTTPESAPTASVSSWRDQLRSTLRQTLDANGGNMAATARQLGMSRTTLYKKLRES